MTAGAPHVSVIVSQLGGRRKYSYATELYRYGVLHSLVTDFVLREAAHSLTRRFAPPLDKRLARRVAPNIGNVPLHSFPVVNLYEILARPFQAKELRYKTVDDLLGLLAAGVPLHGANVLLTTYGHGGGLVDRARSKGLKIVTDFYITPDVYELVSEARHKIGIADQESDRKDAFVWEQTTRRLLSMSDLYLCPSQRVIADLAKRPEFDSTRARLLPYPVANTISPGATPQPYRVLFAGSFGVRKGAQIVLQAAKIAPEIQFIVAGHISKELRPMAANAPVEFLGHVSRERIVEEYRKADVFFLPTLAEGSAGSVLEALSAGIPVVTSDDSGSVVRNSVDGLVLSREVATPTAYVEAIRRICGDRALRASMSDAARARAGEFTVENWGHCLLAHLRDLVCEPSVYGKLSMPQLDSPA